MVAQFKTKVQKYLKSGETVQVIALPGMGKSRFGRSLGGFLLDPNLFPAKTPDLLINAVKSSRETRLIVIDSFDHLLLSTLTPFFTYLKALRDQHKYQLAFVLLAHRVIGPEHQPLLGDFYEIASEHVLELPTPDPIEYDTFGYSPTSKQLKEIAKLSGGIPALIKISAFALRDNTSLNFDQNPKLVAQIEEMLAVSRSHPAYAGSQLVQDYLKTRSNPILSAAETRLLKLLQENPNHIVSKDQICAIVYPDVKNRAGISDHALDQLVHRLRAKVKSKYNLTTHRGLGYQLSLDSSPLPKL